MPKISSGGRPTRAPTPGSAQARARAESAHRNRVIGFLENVWAELKRVQWPDRRTLTQLTGVVLVFVIITGAYLGLLDAVFSKLINKIL